MSENTGNNPNIIQGKSKPDIEAIIAHALANQKSAFINSVKSVEGFVCECELIRQVLDILPDDPLKCDYCRVLQAIEK